MAWKSWQTFDIYTSYIILTVRNRSCWLLLIWGRKGFVAVRMQNLSPDCAVGWCGALRAAAVSCFFCFLTLPLQACDYDFTLNRNCLCLIGTLTAWLLNCLISELMVFIDAEYAFYNYRTMMGFFEIIGTMFWDILKDIWCCIFSPRDHGICTEMPRMVIGVVMRTIFPHYHRPIYTVVVFNFQEIKTKRR